MGTTPQLCLLTGSITHKCVLLVKFWLDVDRAGAMASIEPEYENQILNCTDFKALFTLAHSKNFAQSLP